MAVLTTLADQREALRTALSATAGWQESGADTFQFGKQTNQHHKRWSLGFGAVSLSGRQRGNLTARVACTLMWSHQLRIDSVQTDQTTALDAQNELLTAVMSTGLPIIISAATIDRASGMDWQIGTISFALSAILPYAPILLTAPSIPSSGAVGAVLSAAPGSYTNTPIALSYSWQSGGVEVGTGTTYTPTAGDAGSDIVVVETATTGAGTITTTTNACAIIAVPTFGFTFPVLLGDTLEWSGTIPMPSSGSVVLLARILDGSTNNTGLFKANTASGNVGLLAGVTNSLELMVRVGNGSGGKYQLLLPTGETAYQIYDGTVKPILITWDAGTTTVRWGKTGPTGTLATPVLVSALSQFLLMNWGGDVTKNSTAGALDIALFTRVITNTEWDAICDNGAGSTPSDAVLRPSYTVAEGTAVTVPADIACPSGALSWSVNTGTVSSNVVAGGLP